MLKEFALEPRILSSWGQFRLVLAHFGISKGRLISRFPSKWKKQVLEALNDAADLGDVDRKRIVESLLSIDDLMVSRQPEWNAGMDWLENAEAEDGRNPFDAIISIDNPRSYFRVVRFDEMDESNPLFAQSPEQNVARTPEDFAREVAPLIRASAELVFQDPYFNPTVAKTSRIIGRLLKSCLNHPRQQPLRRIEFHTIYCENVLGFYEAAQRELPKYIPVGLTLRIVRWKQRTDGDGLHNRYVLTDRGGIKFPWGLLGDDARQSDDINIMSPSTHQKRWNQITSDTPGFEFVDDLTLCGTCPVSQR